MANEVKLDTLNAKVKEEKRKLHKRLVKEHKWVFRLMDVMVVLVILFNFGAILTSNAMIVKDNAEKVTQGIEAPIVIKEVNPVMAKVVGWEEHPEAKQKYSVFIFAAIGWMIMLLVFMYRRTHVHTKLGLMFLFSILLFYFMILGYDFFNDLGFWIGLKLFK